MTHTLAAVFDNRQDAEAARDAVFAEGFLAQEVQLSRADADSDADGIAPPASSDEAGRDDSSIGSSIKRFFSNLFGDDDEDTHTYAEAVNRGHHVLTVQADSLEEVERAADIIEAYGPIDIDERRNEWTSEGWSGGRMAGAGAGAAGGQYLGAQQSAQGSGSSSMGGATGMSGTPDLGGSASLGSTAAVGGATDLGATPTIGGMAGIGSTASMGSTSSIDSGSGLGAGSLQGQTGGASQQFADTGGQGIAGGQAGQVPGQRGMQRGGVRIYQRVTETPLSEDLSLREEQLQVQPLGADDFDDRDDDDKYYRNHWTSNYSAAGGSYDEYAPAYRYGSSMAGADSNQGRSWDDAEPTLRSSWETQYPQSAWDKVKSAVRHGWDRLTS